MRKGLLIIFFIFIFFFTKEFFNYTEINQLGIISTIYLDKENNDILIKASMIIPERDDSESTYKIKLLETKGKNIEEAITNLDLLSNNKIYLSHLNLLVLSNKIIKDDLKIVTDFFIKNKESKNNFSIVNMTDTNLKDVLIEKDLDEKINNLITFNNQKYGNIYKTTIFDLENNLSKNNDFIIPVIIYNETLVLNDNILYKDKQLTNLSLEDTTTYLFLKNKISNFFININSKEIEVINIEKVDNKIISTVRSKYYHENDILKKDYEDYIKEKIKKIDNSIYQYNTNIIKGDVYE